MPLRDALIEAGRVRLRPILMTTVALIAGMIPVALGVGEGADFRAPLGRAVIGGMITSTLLTLLVIPTFYEIMVEGREKVRGRFGRKEKPAKRERRRSRRGWKREDLPDGSDLRILTPRSLSHFVGEGGPYEQGYRFISGHSLSPWERDGG